MKVSTKHVIAISVIYSAFAAAIFGSVAVTGSAWCLLAFVFTPSISAKGESTNVE